MESHPWSATADSSIRVYTGLFLQIQLEFARQIQMANNSMEDVKVSVFTYICLLNRPFCDTPFGQMCGALSHTAHLSMYMLKAR